MPINKTNFFPREKSLTDDTLHLGSSVDSNVGSTINHADKAGLYTGITEWSKHRSCHSQLSTTEAVCDAA